MTMNDFNAMKPSAPQPSESWNDAVEKAFEQVLSYLREDASGKTFLQDPNDGARVEGHYGETHLCAALLTRSRRLNAPEYKRAALKLLDGVLARWTADSRSREYHGDFNNFALALIYEELKTQGEDEAAQKAAQTLLNGPDSRNRTVNWLPMRAYANLVKYELSKRSEFLNIAIDALNVVKSARYNDGMFDDLLPKGASFNLQYCVSTAAVVELISRRFGAIEQLPKIELETTAQTLYGLVFPDGDVNYMGRGCNQIFAWGPWLYFSARYVEPELRSASERFLAERFPTARDNRSLMLNAYDGADRALWWDYHHYTVYLAHLLMWNELAEGVAAAESVRVQPGAPSDSGLRVYKSDSYFAVAFQGRKHYLVERGPALVGVWSKKSGVLFKCGRGPANGMFSNKNFNPFTSYVGHFGLVEIDERPKRIKNKILRKICARFCSQNASISFKPVFCGVAFEETPDGLALTLRTDDKGAAPRAFVLPVLNALNAEDVCVYSDSERLALRKLAQIPTQYGEASVLASRANNAREWRLVVK